MNDTKVLIEKLKSQKELLPDEHDGSYELMRDTIKAYSNLDDLSQIDYHDMNLIYFTSVGTFSRLVSTKEKDIVNSHLKNDDKKNLIKLLNIVWEKTINKQYTNAWENNKPSFGMFGSGFGSFIKFSNEDEYRFNKNSQEFINMLIKVSYMDKDEDIYNLVDKVLQQDFKGVQTGVVSQILHCLKPYTFPILNKNQGKEDDIYKILGIKLKTYTKKENYIYNCKKIKKFRDENLYFKNYRIFDLCARNLI